MGILKNKILKLGIPEKYIYSYSKDIAKIDWKYRSSGKKGKLLLVTAITPTPYGEGKTTTSIGINDCLNKFDKKSICVLREPSMGPVFGIKGGATGGGKCLIIPEEKINYHFTGDFHAITCAHNLISSMIEHHIFYGLLDIDPSTIQWKRAIDMNDRHLRSIKVSIKDNISYETGFQITASSEIMALFCLARNFMELRTMLDDIYIGKTKKGSLVRVKDLNITEALLKILKDAFSPNVVLTAEKNLCLVHGGPFANIAHGCNSIVSTELALNTNDYVVTEAGFGSDLGAEKFLNIKCRKMDYFPDAIILVVTIRALNYHGEVYDKVDPLHIGFKNLLRHVENLKKFNIPLIITLNKFAEDTTKEIDFVISKCIENNINIVINEFYYKGSQGGEELIEQILKTFKSTKEKNYKEIYDINEKIKSKIEKLVFGLYGAQNIKYSSKAMEKINNLNEESYKFPICMAKTPNSFTQDAKNRGVPIPFTANITDIKVLNGAKMIVVYMGNIIDMPGLPKFPLAQKVTQAV